MGLGKTINYARSRQLFVVGYYEVPVHFPVNTLLTDRPIITKINDNSPTTAVALIMNRDNLHDKSSATLISSSYRYGGVIYVGGHRLVFDWTIPNRAQYLIRRDNLLDNFCDFEDFAQHDGDSFFTNDVLEAALKSSQ